MFILFGTHTLKRDHGPRIIECAVCRRATVHTQTCQRLWLTVFWVPVIPLAGRKYLLQCNICGNGFPIRPDQIVPGFASPAGPVAVPAALTSFQEIERRAKSAQRRARWYCTALVVLSVVTLFFGGAFVGAIPQTVANPKHEPVAILFAAAIMMALLVGLPAWLTWLVWGRWRRNRKAAKDLQIEMQTKGALAGAALLSTPLEIERRAKSALRRARWYGVASIPLFLATLLLAGGFVNVVRELALDEKTPVMARLFAGVFGLALLVGLPVWLTTLVWRRWRGNRQEAKDLHFKMQAAGTAAGR